MLKISSASRRQQLSAPAPRSFRVRKYESLETIGLKPKGFYQRSSFALTTKDSAELKSFLVQLASINRNVGVHFHIQVGLERSCGSTWFVLRGENSFDVVQEQCKVLSQFPGRIQCRIYPVPSEDVQYGRYLYTFHSQNRCNSAIENIAEFHGPSWRAPVNFMLRQSLGALRRDECGGKREGVMVSERQSLQVRHLIASTRRQIDRLASLVGKVMPEATEMTLDFVVYGTVNGVVQIPSIKEGAPSVFRMPHGAFWIDFDPPVTYSEATTKKIVELIEAGEYPSLE